MYRNWTCEGCIPILEKCILLSSTITSFSLCPGKAIFASSPPSSVPVLEETSVAASNPAPRLPTKDTSSMYPSTEVFSHFWVTSWRSCPQRLKDHPTETDAIQTLEAEMAEYLNFPSYARYLTKILCFSRLSRVASYPKAQLPTMGNKMPVCSCGSFSTNKFGNLSWGSRFIYLLVHLCCLNKHDCKHK